MAMTFMKITRVKLVYRHDLGE